MIFNLGAVEGAFADEHFVLDAERIKARHQSMFGLVPHGIFTNAHRRASRHLVGDVSEAEGLVDLLHERGKSFAFGKNLIFRAENVTVVLSEAAHTHEAMERTRRLIAVALTEFTNAQRQITVAAKLRIEDLDVAGAVHRLERVVAVLRLRREHIVAVLRPVTGTLPQRAVKQLGSFHFFVAIILIDAAHELLDHLPERPAFGMPEDHARRFILQMEEIEFATKAAVITLFGLSEHLEISLLLILRRPGRTVDALEHFVLAVAAPVGARHLHQVMHLEAAR